MGRPETSWRRRLDGVVGRAIGRLLDSAPSAPAQARVDEEVLLGSVERYLERGRALRRWWRGADRARLRRRFDLGSCDRRGESGFGFFDQAEVDGAAMPIMGCCQRMFYDRPKVESSSPAECRTVLEDQLRAFVLRYFMRISVFPAPRSADDRIEHAAARRRAPNPPRPLDPRTQGRLRSFGFAFSQRYYKTLDGAVGRFPPDARATIVDLRQLAERYAWIVVKLRVLDFAFTWAPLGSEGPRISLPTPAESFIVLSPDLITDRPSDPAAGRREGHYGLGYAFIKDPRCGPLGYGPGAFDAAIELIDFRVDPAGAVAVAMAFLSNRPQRLIDVPIDPAAWGLSLARRFGGPSDWLGALDRLHRLSPLHRLRFDPLFGALDAADLLSGGAAEERLGLSRRSLEEAFLIKHFEQHHRTLAATLHSWRQVPNWLDSAALPGWAEGG